MLITISGEHEHCSRVGCVTLSLSCCHQETEFKVNTEDVFKRAQKMVEELSEEKQTLDIQREEVCVCVCTWQLLQSYQASSLEAW